jgi:GNAT superfamily N-acetyltransferase
MPIEKDIIKRKEKKLLKKIKSPKLYKIIAWFIFFIFWFRKKYLVLNKKNKNKRLWLISITYDKIFWKKIWYIDDFIVDKKVRWKWIWSKLFTKALEKLEKEQKSDYVFLVTKKDRKLSHNIYKKFWFSLISFWIGYLAYKKRNK